MTKRIFRSSDQAGLLMGTALLAALTACVVEKPNQRRESRDAPAVQAQATVVIQDDYDYYPGYEIYYSRNRHEYVYRDGDAWVRRSEPRGVTASVLLAAPSVRMDFHDAPAQHHASVAQNYPKNWTPPGKNQDARDERRPGNKDDQKPGDRKN